MMPWIVNPDVVVIPAGRLLEVWLVYSDTIHLDESVHIDMHTEQIHRHIEQLIEAMPIAGCEIH
jgi:hypothetical protein